MTESIRGSRNQKLVIDYLESLLSDEDDQVMDVATELAHSAEELEETIIDISSLEITEGVDLEEEARNLLAEVEQDESVAGIESTESVETETVETQTAESRSAETETAETQLVETESVETESVETESVETESVETESVETETAEAESVETETVEAEKVETEAEDAESVETETVKAESVEAEAEAEVEVETAAETAGEVSVVEEQETSTEREIAQAVSVATESSVQPVKEESEQRINCVIVLMYGLKLAIPFEDIEGMIKLSNVSLSLDNDRNWILGDFTSSTMRTHVVDTAQILFGENYDPLKSNYNEMLVLAGKHWSIVFDKIIKAQSILISDVTENPSPQFRPWLTGTYMAEKCALVNVPAMVKMFEEELNG